MTRIPAVYRDGVFVPDAELELANDTPAEILIEDAALKGVKTLNSEQRAQLRLEAVATMRQQRLSREAPRFTREELHDRI